MDTILQILGVLVIIFGILLAAGWLLGRFIQQLSKYVLFRENRQLQDRISYLEAQLVQEKQKST